MKLTTSQLATACFLDVNSGKVNDALMKVFFDLSERSGFYLDKNEYNLVKLNYQNWGLSEKYNFIEVPFQDLTEITKYKILWVILTTLTRYFPGIDGKDQKVVNWWNLGSCNGVDMEAWKEWNKLKT